MDTLTNPTRDGDMIHGLRQESFYTGRIIAEKKGEYFLVGPDGTRRWAKKAGSCLLKPATGDIVLAWNGQIQGTFIISLLIRENQGMHLIFEGPTTITSGPLAIQGPVISIDASESASMRAPEVDLSGSKGRARFTTFSFIASSFYGHCEQVTTIMRSCHSVMQRLTQRVRDSFRTIERIDETRAAIISQTASGRFSVNAGHAVIVAEDDVTIDGEKIHLG
jgi:hypothetical protein